MYKVATVIKATMAAILLASVALPISAGEAASARPHLIYFYNPSCRLCTKTNAAVAQAEEKYKDKLTFERFNIADPENGIAYMDQLFNYLDELSVPEDVSTLLTVVLGEIVDENGEERFVPQTILLEDDDIAGTIDQAIEKFLTEKGGNTLGMSHPAAFFSDTALASAPPESQNDPAAQEQSRSSRSKRRAQNDLRFGAISAAALADSINPCAFATIIILVAMMSSAKRTKKEIVAVCLAFTVSVYLTYFAIGLFLYRVIAAINAAGGWYLVLADIVYYIAFLLCIVCGILCLRDAILLFSGKSAEEMVLQLPKAFKKRINVAMAKGVRARWLVFGVFIAGVTVSFLEAACTGQVYLPTILIIAEASFWQSILLLAWYNLLFVLPLLIVFALVLLGITSQQLADFFKKNVAWTKLALTIVFLIMGWWVGSEMYWPPGYRG